MSTSAPDKQQNFSWQSYDSFKDEIETCNDCIFRPILKGSWFYSLLVTPDENDSCCFWGRKPTPWGFQGFFFAVRSKTSLAFTKLDTTTSYSPYSAIFSSMAERIVSSGTRMFWNMSKCFPLYFQKFQVSWVKLKQRVFSTSRKMGNWKTAMCTITQWTSFSPRPPLSTGILTETE